MNTREQPSTSAHPPLMLRWLPGRYAICRVARSEAGDLCARLSCWASSACHFLSITCTEDELSIIVSERDVPGDFDGIVVESGWVAMQIAGRLEFDLLGILAKLASALAAAGVPVCAVSTFSTDILLVKADCADRAVAALSAVARFDT